MIRTYTGVQYILKHTNGNGELADTFDSVEAAKRGREEAQEREIAYRKEFHFDNLTPTNYLIVRRSWSNIYDDDTFVSHTTQEIVVPE